MAIEYANKPEPESPAEDSSSGEESDQTVSIPDTILGGKTVSPGDVIRLEVVSSDNGTITAKYATEDDPESDMSGMGGIAGAASKFES